MRWTEYDEDVRKVVRFIAELILVVFIGMLVVSILMTTDAKPGTLSEQPQMEMISHKKMLKKHGLDRVFSVVYVRHNGTMYFIRNGIRCEFK